MARRAFVTRSDGRASTSRSSAASIRRDEPVTSDGPNYPLPLHGGSGKPLKANVRPLRADVPIFLAAMGPRNVALAAEIADRWIPFLYSPERAEVFAPSLAEDRGGAIRHRVPRRRPHGAARDRADPTECRDRLRPLLAFYVGAMGSREANFYKDLVTAYGFGDVAATIQEAFLDGRRTKAARLVTDEMIDELCLVGPAERVRDRLDAWESAGVTTLLARVEDPATIHSLADAAT